MMAKRLSAAFQSEEGVVIPFIELIAGALGFVLAIVTFGHLLKEPLYELHTHVIP